MSEKRRDNKNRILRTGESQRKDGRYTYKYVDAFGKPQFVYAWKLVPTDRTPAGKREDISLREKEQQIRQDLNDGIDTAGKKLTVYELFKKYLKQQRNSRLTTQNTYRYLLEFLKKDKFGARRIDTVKISDVKAWLLELRDSGLAYSTVLFYKRALKPAFKMALHDNCIRKNPFDFSLNSVMKNDTQSRQAMTQEQEERLLTYIQSDVCYRKHYDEIIILLRTGLRISEFCGLTVNDLDFKNRIINVDHQLIKVSKIGYVVQPPKSENGIRQIPMSDEVYQAFKNILKHRKIQKELVIDGYKDFLFINRNGNPQVSVNYEAMFRKLIAKYNSKHEEQLPKITPHVMRHTFCTRLANAGMNPKALQYVMGHSNITITLNLYAHASLETVKSELQRFVV
ncbi:tyrosine-type recombinase/integrase [Clostridium perfringens]|uniref:tyrosine-type recombinase/integrase n=1 Tax=Clostridium perfringens TaxID=1502 RepID=UPI00297A4144|nr:tyrosine-type recombinase/integrase [Clostridium perfringens]MDK0728335.1 tyrosine-type recombinase/integrase [Clostridium perfringens]MDK0803635.1 tyrosine-type recombinase/integrase [Clostridium perfringens]MDM0547916.1 tyrosine-type recombinase/integrase [Clostridium perfringens]MDM0565491.1 tyrosine-type recombinase/integrase [Clostridium perfringens]MDM0573247.1 tyrosine-type recombinase/integrase [Clostridium perfringens]